MRAPHETIHRITLALEMIATGEGAAEKRIYNAYNALLPLHPGQFLVDEERDLFEQIMNFPSDEKPLSKENMREHLNKIWRFYWLISANTEFA